MAYFKCQGMATVNNILKYLSTCANYLGGYTALTARTMRSILCAETFAVPFEGRHAWTCQWQWERAKILDVLHASNNVFSYHFSLFHHVFRSQRLHIRRIAIFPEYPFNRYAQLRADTFFQ